MLRPVPQIRRRPLSIACTCSVNPDELVVTCSSPALHSPETFHWHSVTVWISRTAGDKPERREMPMLMHLRMSVPDRPGMLAQITAALADVGADIRTIAVLERETGRAIDDIYLSWPEARS